MKSFVSREIDNSKSISDNLIALGCMDMTSVVSDALSDKSELILKANPDLFYSLWSNYEDSGRTLTKFKPFLKKLIGGLSKDFTIKDMPFVRTNLKCEKCEGTLIGKPGERRSIHSYSDTRASLLCLKCHHYQNIFDNHNCRCLDCVELKNKKDSIVLKNLKESFESPSKVKYSTLTFRSKVILHTLLSSLPLLSPDKDHCILTGLHFYDKDKYPAFPTIYLARALILELYRYNIVFPDIEYTIKQENYKKESLNCARDSFDVLNVILRVNVSGNKSDIAMSHDDLLIELSKDLEGDSEDSGVRKLCDDLYVSLAYKYLLNAVEYIYESQINHVMTIDCLSFFKKALKNNSLSETYDLIDLEIISHREERILIDGTYTTCRDKDKLIKSFISSIEARISNPQRSQVVSGLFLSDDDEINDYYGIELEVMVVSQIEISAFQKACNMKYCNWVKI